ncbi:MAG: hypothetical protein J5934_08470 [Succinivibrio sp.]|nr:hypothetical protein [Succinivibrio sp.]
MQRRVLPSDEHQNATRSLLLLFTPLLVFIFAFGAAFFYLAFYEFRVDTDLAIYSIISIAVMFVVLVCQCALLLTYLK